MVSELLLNKILSEVLPTLSNSANEDEMLNRFTSSLESVFGISKVSAAANIRNRPAGSIFDYVINTKKTYTDNQLSEYSAFPELIDYKNKGYKSCALFPIVANGKVFTILEMLSEHENKFSEDLINGVMFAAYLAGFALMYKSENSLNKKLANYFDAAFNSPYPQMLVSKDGSIAKFNKAAIKELGVSQQTKGVNEVGIGVDKIITASRQHSSFKQAHSGKYYYTIYAENVGENLFHVFFQNTTEPTLLSGMFGAVGGTDYSCVFVLDNDLAILEVRGMTERVFNYPSGLFYGKNMQNYIDEKQRETLRKNLQSLGDGGFYHTVLDLNLGDSGTTHTHLSFVRQYYGYLALAIKANSEKYIKDVKELLDDFTSISSDIVMKVDGLGYIRECNLPVEHALGYKKDEIIGKEIKGLYQDTSLLDRDMTYVKNGGKIDGTYVNIFKKDGSLIPATHSMRALKNEDNTIEYLVDVKELQTKSIMDDQESMIRKQDSEIKSLKSTSELKSQFIYNISHELKTPLTAIKGFSQLLYDGGYGPLNEEQKGFVKTILDESDRLTLIIQQVLDATKLEANKVKLDLKEVDLKAMQNNPSIKALEESAREKDLEFSWSVDYDVPNITADPNRLIQVFVNLIGNSIKFTEKGSIGVRIKKKSKKRIECSVSDTGIGISDEDKRKIFKKFYQAPKKELVKQDGAGTGLGLSITKDIISLHHGRISFESVHGKGTTFSFLLPIRAKEQKK